MNTATAFGAANASRERDGCGSASSKPWRGHRCDQHFARQSRRVITPRGKMNTEKLKLRQELLRFCRAFGFEKGGQLFATGVSLEEALKAETKLTGTDRMAAYHKAQREK